MSFLVFLKITSILTMEKTRGHCNERLKRGKSAIVEKKAFPLLMRHLPPKLFYTQVQKENTCLEFCTKDKAK